jgi:hypothetical protein
MVCEEEHCAVRRFSKDQAFSLVSCTLKNVVINNHNIGPMSKDLTKGLHGVFGLRHDGHVGLVVKQTPDALSQPYDVVGDDAPNFFAFLILCDGTHRVSFSKAREIERFRRLGKPARAKEDVLTIVNRLLHLWNAKSSIYEKILRQPFVV